MWVYSPTSAYSRGGGGLDLGSHIARGFRTVCYVEFDKRAQHTLRSRITDRKIDDAPIWDDVTTFDGRPWTGLVDVVSGGFPCQDVSSAGKRRGIKEGTRSGLWHQFRRIISEVGPRFVLVENVAGLVTGGGIGTVLGALDELGYDARWEVISAADVGAPHLRQRVWIVAHAKRLGGIPWRQAVPAGHGDMGGLLLPDRKGYWNGLRVEGATAETIWKVHPGPIIHRVADGMADWPYRIKQCGNGVVPQSSVPAGWRQIKEIAEANMAVGR